LDLKVWAFAMMFFNSTIVSYALSYFTPLILTRSLGFDAAASQLLVAPPAAFAGIIMFTTGWLGDRYRIRGPVVVFNVLLTIVGLAILGWHTNSSVRYFGIFFATAGPNSNIPALMAYQGNNIRGQWKRAFCSATLVGFGGIGGIAGSLVFR
jgi:MFS family permease